MIKYYIHQCVLSCLVLFLIGWYPMDTHMVSDIDEMR